MRFTPVIFAGVAAAGIYYPEPSSSAPATSSTPAWPVKQSTSSAPADYWPKPSSSAVSSSKKGWKTSTKYETECWTVTSSSSTKVWTSIKAIPTVCEDDEDSWPVPSSKSTPAAPVKPTTWSTPYCEAYTETCTVTVTASSAGSWSTPVAPVKPTTPAAPVYPASSAGSWPAGAAKPSGTGSWTSPYAAQFTGAASAQKAGALLAGAGAVAAMLL